MSQSNAAPDAAEGKKSYKDTLNLPTTTFPMKANLVQNEPASQKRWEQMGLYEKVRAARSGAEKFTFHDGPPYANGSIHVGHLFNKSLKDFVVRSQTMMGRDCQYVPGWDCHGLPIEHKVQQELIEKGKYAKLLTLAEDLRRMAVRRECAAYAEKFVKLHIGQMSRILTLADYQHPYMTMAPAYEGATMEALSVLVERGLVYRALKPVHWSPANETALADAELEYYDREDPSVYVDFEAAEGGRVYDAFGLAEADDDEEEDETPAPEGGEETPRASVKPGVRPHSTPSFMIWTTTPWTLPANLAIAVNPKFVYALVWVDGNVTVMAADAVERVTKRGRSEQVVVLATTTGDRLVGLRYRHPFVPAAPKFAANAGGDAGNCYKIVAADYVTLEDGTGLVHTAPGHGVEDYQTGLRESIPVYCPVRENGTYDDSVPDWLRGLSVWKANDEVIKHLRASGHMFHDHMFTHSYPHDWRGKSPVIFRCTEQWFVSVDHKAPGVSGGADGSLREAALATTARDVGFVPEWGRNRMRGMLESRPDWCISRQRAWGLPIPAFFLADGTCFMTARSARAVAAKVREKGSDVWFNSTAEQLLTGYDPSTDPDAPESLQRDPTLVKQARKGSDILDVWFESGASWNAVMRERNLGYPVDLYLEGSDQHRGWFQLSLLLALGVTGVAPFRTLLTHGFIVDKEGKKLSKSRPDAHLYEVDKLLQDYGADVIRWWVSSLTFENDVKLDREFIDVAGESYRKVRNTVRFMLSNLNDFAAGSATALPAASIDAWALSKYRELESAVKSAYLAYDFRGVHAAIYDFCNTTLSAVYLAAVKDRLYCDRADSPRRRRTQGVMWAMTDGLCRLIAPIMPHTADEAYRTLHKGDACVHMQSFPETADPNADPRWAKVMALRDQALLAMEKAKKAAPEGLGVENPLDMGVAMPAGGLDGLDPHELADLLGVSKVTLDSAAEPRVIDLRDQPRCERSWRRDGTVKRRADGGMLSDRDAEAVGTA